MSVPLALTLGDPAGIGPEITWKAWDALRGDPSHSFAVIAPPSVLKTVDRPDHPIAVIDSLADTVEAFPNALPILPIDGERAHPGKPDPKHANTITGSIDRAVSAALNGRAAAVITNPIAKDVLYQAGFQFPGHTEYLGVLCDGHPSPYALPESRGPVMMLTAQGLRVGLATIHIPLAQVPKQLSHALIRRRALTLLGALKTDFGFENPRLAVCGLNPHAGENGAIGTEDRDLINPVCEQLRAEGHRASNALPADTLFHAEARETYDGVLAMYHDQGLIPVKTLDFHGGVNVTLGLPIVRTSPDHGTAFNIAGQGRARADSLIAAIRQARAIADMRRG
jgi:4-hydroxythreonine-4-phosphate dehydrogenase